MREARKDALRVGSDRSVKLKFHGSTVRSDAGLLACCDLNEPFARTTSYMYVLVGEIR